MTPSLISIDHVSYVPGATRTVSPASALSTPARIVGASPEPSTLIYQVLARLFRGISKQMQEMVIRNVVSKESVRVAIFALTSLILYHIFHVNSSPMHTSISVEISSCYNTIRFTLQGGRLTLELRQGSVIDGQQRLSAIHRYLNNEYLLSGLKVKPELNKKRFHQLSQEDQRLILSRTIRCIVILKESHPDIRFDVFERLNTGSSQLSTQELRNCIYRGELNDLIRKLSEDPNFQYVRDVDGPDLRMKDNEMVLRFFAFYEKMPEYRGNLKKFLDDYQKEGMKKDKNSINNMEKIFFRVINDVKLVFGQNAFRKYDPQKKSWERSVNRAIYDAVMICFANASSNEIASRKDLISEGLKVLCESDKEFRAATGSATKDRAKVKIRIVQFRNTMIERGVNVNDIKFWD